MDKPIKLSVLISARRNSKYLAKFLAGLIMHSGCISNLEILLMTNAHDTWNKEIINWFDLTMGLIDVNIRFVSDTENLQLGRAGLHEYFNILAKEATGDWLIYFCEDHFTSMDRWDIYLFDEIKKRNLDSKQIWCIIPKFDNAGAMNQVISRGYYNALGYMGRHGWIDSYLNDVNTAIPDRVIKLDAELFHDFTHDKPSPMSEAHCQSVISKQGETLPKYDSEINRMRIEEDRKKLLKYIAREGKL